MPRLGRPWHVATAFGAMAHHGFELGAGVGLVCQPWLGLGGATALWGTVLPAWLASTRSPSRTFDVPQAFAAGMSLGGVALHFAMWPWRWCPLPYLVRAEGLRDAHLPTYNAILWSWGGAAIGALTFETRRRLLPIAAAGTVTALAFRPSARRHFEWVHEQALVRPAWWNRALAGTRP